jgi:hypothetical protein
MGLQHSPLMQMSPRTMQKPPLKHVGKSKNVERKKRICSLLT